ncbi:UNKNOWN [Stylonychia lemnae]|uniref:Uncharacterized protein n=1 Tax=Stylonychia lemnae TaxID=5949 RepID=A0A078A3W9_STYLE|nr:UNKNOWN [Stylonychia lemnae]|eukprot:CDW76857.1 UNKNOWN [Stylonychia lemnae]
MNESLNIPNLSMIDFRRNSIAYELSNDDYSADLAGALADSSYSNDQISRKQSTMTFGENNPDKIVQRRRRRKNRNRKGTQQPLVIQKPDLKNMFRSPQLTYQMKNSSKSHTITPQVKKFNAIAQGDSQFSIKEKSLQSKDLHTIHEEQEDGEERLKLELEEEFKQYLDFNENQQYQFTLPPPQLDLSPSKMDIASRLFSKHKRFSLHPQNSIEEFINQDKIECLEKEQEKQIESNCQRPRDKKYDKKINKDRESYQKEGNQNKCNNFNNKHLKYKFQTHKNQMKKVPQAPFINNQYLMQNVMKPVYEYTPNFQRLSANCLLRGYSQQSENKDSFTQSQYFYQNQLESPYILRENNFNDLGASMAFVIGSDSFLNDDSNLDICDQKTASEHKEDNNNNPFNLQQHQQQQHQQSNSGQSSSQQLDQIVNLDQIGFNQPYNNEDQLVRLPNKREQMIKEIEQQKRLISKLLKEIGEKDRILKDYQLKQQSNQILPIQ